MAEWGWSPIGNSESVGTYSRRFVWRYQGDRYRWEMELPRDHYTVHSKRPRVYDYGSYVADELTQGLFDGFCETVESISTKRGFDDREQVTFVARFVQSLPYTADDVSTDYRDYPRYPIETLVDETGDCQDSSLLLAALLFGLDYDVALARLDGHLGVLVYLPDAPGNVEHDGREFSYIEATGTGWDVGQLPESHENDYVRLQHVHDSPALYARWRARADHEWISCSGTVVNRGMAPAENVRIHLTLETKSGRTVAGVGEGCGRIEPGEEVRWEGSASVDGEGRFPVTPEWVLTDDERTHDHGTAPRKRL